MNLNQMFNEVQIALDRGEGKLLRRGEFDAALVQALRVINSETEKANEAVRMVRLSGNPETIENQVEFYIQDDPYYIAPDNTFEDITFNATENSITLPSYWEKVTGIYRGGEKLRAVSFDVLKKGGYYSDYYLANNVVRFNFSVMNEGLELVFVYRREYPLPKRDVVEYTGMPEYGYQLLFSAIVLALLSRFRFFDQNIYNIYRHKYNDAVIAFNDRNLSMAPNMKRLNTFAYSKEIL